MSILLENVTKRLVNHTVVDRINLTVKDREFFVLLGPSGSGKSTILRLIAGLTPLTSGKIFLHGHQVDHLPPQERGIGYVFQNYSLFRHMTVADNIEFGLRIRAVPPSERQRRREQLLEILGLGGYGDRFPCQLSGGQQQRVALARALAYSPDVLLLDEPFGALDVKIRAQLRESLKAIHQELGVTSILVTHDQEEAFELGDRIAVLEQGKLVEVGLPEELYQKPKTEYVASFLGTANLLRLWVSGAMVNLGQASLPLPPPFTSAAPSQVDVLIRPEDIELNSAQEKLTTTCLGYGEIKKVTPVGPGVKIRVTLKADQVEFRHALPPLPNLGVNVIYVVTSARAYAQEGFRPGHHVWLGIRNYHVLPYERTRVLLAIDGSAYQEYSLELGKALFPALQSEVDIIGIAERRSEQQKAQAGLVYAERVVSPAARRVRTLYRQGNAADMILGELEKAPYDLVMIGTRGRRAPTRFKVGSTAARVLQYSLTPILVIPAERKEIKNILICVTAGEPGRIAILQTGRMALKAQAKVTVLHVVSSGFGSPAAAKEAPVDEDGAKAQVDRALQLLTSNQINAVKKVRSGHTVEEILAEANSGNYDLVVTGAYLPYGHSSLLVDNFTTQILANIHVPMLVVRYKEGFPRSG
ncbi:MAG: ATP-binding cassette domain-containing protein [Acidobacteria bacterium]|nr:ATP-binding cassette domain-containing protein [Acidobacteriota bacterium]MBI3657269.1 ATP-binding cassette domain-containing protein [Acidobacteriota bacterium]